MERVQMWQLKVPESNSSQRRLDDTEQGPSFSQEITMKNIRQNLFCIYLQRTWRACGCRSALSCVWNIVVASYCGGVMRLFPPSASL